MSAAPRLHHLDGLRGVAALAVVLHHYGLTFYPALNSADAAQSHFAGSAPELFLAASPLHVLWSGHFAVCVFFVLSGFVLSAGYFRRPEAAPLANAALRRYPRLAGPVFVACTLAYLLMKAHLLANRTLDPSLTFSTWLPRFWRFDATLPGLLKDALYITFTAPETGLRFLAPVLWTMKFELWGSLLVFATLALFHARPGARWLAYAALLITTAGGYYVGFVLGLALSEATRGGGRLPYRPNALLTAALLTGAIYFGAFRADQPLWAGIARISPAEALWHHLGAALLLTAVLGSGWLHRVLGSSGGTWLGRVSFGVYLLHPLVLGTLGVVAFRAAYAAGWAYHTAAAASLAAGLALTLGAAELFARWVDGPVVRALR